MIRNVPAKNDHVHANGRSAVLLIGRMNWSLGELFMIRKMLTAALAVLFVVGVTTAADEKKSDPDQASVNGTFVKFDADKNEITIKVDGKNQRTFMVAQDVKVAVGEVKDLKKLKADDPVMLTLKKDGDKTMVIEVRQGKQPRGSASPSPSQL